MSRNHIQVALEFEARRKKFLAEGNLIELLKTYRDQKVFLPDSNTGEFWDEKFAANQPFFPMELWRTQKIVGLVNCRRSLLNIGVGKGKLEEMLINKCPKVDYLGTDIATKTIHELKQKFPQLKFRKCAPSEINPRHQQFDQILLLEVLEHIRPNRTFPLLTHIKKLLKDDGVFIVSVPINEGLEQMLPTNPNSHMRLYSPELLRFELEVSGFRVEKMFSAPAFESFFNLKQFINQVIKLKQPNNIILVCRKKVSRT